MVGFLKKLFSRDDAAQTDAERIYRALMGAARQPAFYGPMRAEDNYDGRIDVLTLHLSTVLHALNSHGEQGKRLSQAVYEAMRQDFDIALREEGMSDTGVMKRIKPMIRLFYTRIKAYTDAFEADNSEPAMAQALETGMLKEGREGFAPDLAAYAVALRGAFENKTLGEIALMSVDLPPAPKAI